MEILHLSDESQEGLITTLDISLIRVKVIFLFLVQLFLVYHHDISLLSDPNDGSILIFKWPRDIKHLLNPLIVDYLEGGV
jgi:hypothetical protein